MSPCQKLSFDWTKAYLALISGAAGLQVPQWPVSAWQALGGWVHEQKTPAAFFGKLGGGPQRNCANAAGDGNFWVTSISCWRFFTTVLSVTSSSFFERQIQKVGRFTSIPNHVDHHQADHHGIGCNSVAWPLLGTESTWKFRSKMKHQVLTLQFRSKMKHQRSRPIEYWRSHHSHSNGMLGEFINSGIGALAPVQQLHEQLCCAQEQTITWGQDGGVPRRLWNFHALYRLGSCRRQTEEVTAMSLVLYPIRI